MALPEQYLNFEHMKQITETVLRVLEIPAEVIFEATFFSTAKVTGYFAEEPGVMGNGLPCVEYNCMLVCF